MDRTGWGHWGRLAGCVEKGTKARTASHPFLASESRSVAPPILQATDRVLSCSGKAILFGACVARALTSTHHGNCREYSLVRDFLRLEGRRILFRDSSFASASDIRLAVPFATGAS